MKKLLFAILILVGSVAAQAQVADTTVVIDNPVEVTINTTDITMISLKYNVNFMHSPFDLYIKMHDDNTGYVLVNSTRDVVSNSPEFEAGRIIFIPGKDRFWVQCETAGCKIQIIATTAQR